ncbi:MAG TPA: lytic transglycosylase domain-containing protein, partial [Chloroflexota bacterium]|nr:lytic transglycosylase domain-containing protein [Chloroflexota bacterium]
MLKPLGTAGFTPSDVQRLPKLSVSTSAFLQELARAFTQESSAVTARERSTTKPPVAGFANSSLTGIPAYAAPPLTGPLASLVTSVAGREGVPPALVAAVVDAESGFNSLAVSSAGAKGLMQLMDGTARGLGVTNPFDPEQNLVGGTRFLRGLLDRYHGNLTLALAAYNAGPGAVDAAGGQVPPFPETQLYVR